MTLQEIRSTLGSTLVRLGIRQSEGAIPDQLHMEGLVEGKVVVLGRRRLGYGVDPEAKVVEASVRLEMPPGQYKVLFDGTTYVKVIRLGDKPEDIHPDIGWYAFQRFNDGTEGDLKVALFDDRSD